MFSHWTTVLLVCFFSRVLKSWKFDGGVCATLTVQCTWAILNELGHERCTPWDATHQGLWMLALLAFYSLLPERWGWRKIFSVVVWFLCQDCCQLQYCSWRDNFLELNPWSHSAAARTGGNILPVCRTVWISMGKWLSMLPFHVTVDEVLAEKLSHPCSLVQRWLSFPYVWTELSVKCFA